MVLAGAAASQAKLNSAQWYRQAAAVR